MSNQAQIEAGCPCGAPAGSEPRSSSPGRWPQAGPAVAESKLSNRFTLRCPPAAPRRRQLGRGRRILNEIFVCRRLSWEGIYIYIVLINKLNILSNVFKYLVFNNYFLNNMMICQFWATIVLDDFTPDWWGPWGRHMRFLMDD